MELVLLGSILLLRVVQSITGKSCSKLMPTDFTGVANYMSLRMAISAVGGVALLILGGNVLSSFTEMSGLGWVISAATGCAIAISGICSLLVLKNASVVLGSLFSASGLLVPTIGGIFIFNQSVGIGQWLGIFCLLVSAVLLSLSSKKTNGKITFKTIFLLFGSMIFNGTTMLLQALFKEYVPNGNVSLYSFLQFLIPAIFLFVISIISSAKSKEKLPRTNKKLLLHTVFAALAVLGISQISTVASEIIPVAVLFPISDGGGTVISAIVACVMFKENFTIKSSLGIIIGILGLVMIKLL